MKLNTPITFVFGDKELNTPLAYFSIKINWRQSHLNDPEWGSPRSQGTPWVPELCWAGIQEVMTSETYLQWNFCNNIEDHFIDLPREKIFNFTNKNVEGKKSTEQLTSYMNRTVGQAVKSPNKLCKVIYHRKSSSSFFQILVIKRNSLPTPPYPKKLGLWHSK